MQPEFYSSLSAFRTHVESQKQSEQTRLSRELYLIAAINEQFLLTQHLIQNQYRLSQQLKKERSSSDSGQSSQNNNKKRDNSLGPEYEQFYKFASEKLDDSSSHKSPKQQEPLTRLRIKKVFKYDVDSDSYDEKKQLRKCQTKNIIKNFIKSIFNFIRKHRAYTQSILQKHRIEQNNFMSVVESLNGKVNTIQQLRQLWTQKPYNQIFRIISSYFLRRYSLRHIFHSRISNHQIHLKYRRKLLQSIEKPEQFTSLKDF